MKKIIFFVFINLFFIVAAVSQRQIKTSGCVGMYGDSDIDKKGCWYYAYIKNNCSKPVYVSKSKFKTRFEYLKETSNDIKTKYTNKNISFPGVFLAAGTSIEKDRDRNDSKSRTYTEVVWQKGELGKVYNCSSGSPNNKAIKISANSQVFIGSNNNVDYYFELNTAFDLWKGFNRYKLTLVAKNKNGVKVKLNSFVSYMVYFQGVAFSGNIYFSGKLKGNRTKRKSESENPIFNFEPEVYVVIKNTNISNSQVSDLTKTKKTNISKSFTDSRDGKVYGMVNIGSQVWMSENLAYKSSSGYWKFDDYLANDLKYGYLYNWETANNVCPDGWELPSKKDFEILLEHYGGEGNTAYQSLKPKGAGNFKTVFAGCRKKDGYFAYDEETAMFWTTTPNDEGRATQMYIDSEDTEAEFGYAPRIRGNSIRCIKKE